MCSGCGDSISQCHTPESKPTTPEAFNSSSPARSIFSSSFSLSSPSNFANANNSKDVHSLTIKKLDQSLQKFISMKKVNNTNKTNLLRLSLLKYLRYPPSFYKSLSLLLATSLSDLNVDLMTFEATVLLNWWTNLLNLLTNDYQSILSLDRSAYLESISRLSNLNIWKFLSVHPSTFNNLSSNYNQLILKTFELSISRLNLKSSSIAFEIFAGKIFSLAFFNLPLISHGLAFLLNTKIKSFKSIHSICFNEFSNFNGILDDLSTQFPTHLNLLLTSSLKPRPTKFIIENKFLNSIHPPKDKINGINDTRGPWTLKWCSLDNINLFCAFLRNYLSLLSVHFKNFPSIMINDNFIFLSPGFLCLLTHCFEIFDAEINFKLKNLKSTSNLNQPNVSVAPSTSLLYSHTNGCLKELPSEKIFKVLRDLITNPRTPYECLLNIGFIKGIENIFKVLILNTKLLDLHKIELIFNLFIDFVRSIDVVIDFNSILDSSLITPFLDHLDWKFWLNTILKLLNSNNSQLESRSILILYKLWDFISWNNYDIGNSFLKSKCEDNWISNLKLNLKSNLIIYLTKDSKWNSLFGNYNSLTRQLFIKFLIWKVLGFKFIGLNSIGEVNNDNHRIFEQIEFKLLNTLNKTKDIHFKPCGPILNKKFIINEIKSHLDKSKIRTYPFEVIDDFDYSNSSLLNNGSTQQSNEKSPRVINKTNNKSNKLQDFFTKPNNSANNSSSNLFGKLFRSDSASSKKLFKKPPSISSLSSIRSSDNSSISCIESSFSKFSVSDLVEEDYYFDNNNLKPAPETLLKSIEFIKYDYEFNLVNDDSKIQLHIQNLNILNANGSKFKFGGLNIDHHSKNYELNLPSVDMDMLYNKIYFKNKVSSNKDTINRDSLIGSLKLDLNGNDYLNMMNFQPESVLTPTNDTLFGNSDSTCNSFTSAKGSDSEMEVKEEEQQEDGDDDVQLPFFVNLANGIHEFNNEVEVFNEFIQARILELESGDIVRSAATTKWIKEYEEAPEEEEEEEEEFIIEIKHNSLNKYQLTPMAMRKLQRTIPQIIPEIQNDKLNAY